MFKMKSFKLSIAKTEIRGKPFKWYALDIDIKPENFLF